MFQLGKSPCMARALYRVTGADQFIRRWSRLVRTSLFPCLATPVPMADLAHLQFTAIHRPLRVCSLDSIPFTLCSPPCCMCANMCVSKRRRTGSPLWKGSGSGSLNQESPRPHEQNTVVGASYSHANILKFAFPSVISS